MDKADPSSHLVSVVIPTFNGAETIERTLNSVLSQEAQTEIVLVDDFSLDSTVEKARGILTSGRRPFKVLEHDHNKGLSATLNDGIAASSGVNILVLHQDCELMRSDWIATAIKCMSGKVAVVTGYYGLSDPSEMNLAKKTFGLLRRQIHLPPGDRECETVNFSEGKCDLYNARVLQSIGGFPERYRIAGEDLSVSIRLQQLGLKIIKSYHLPVIQRYRGRAESFRGNFGKEFEFGKAMGGIIGEHKSDIFSGVVGEGYGKSRTLHRISQVLQILALILLSVGYLLTRNALLFPVIGGLIVLRYVYYIALVWNGLKHHQSLAKHKILDMIWMPLIGLSCDPVYSLGLAYGLFKWTLSRGKI